MNQLLISFILDVALNGTSISEALNVYFDIDTEKLNIIDISVTDGNEVKANKIVNAISICQDYSKELREVLTIDGLEEDVKLSLDKFDIFEEKSKDWKSEEQAIKEILSILNLPNLSVNKSKTEDFVKVSNELIDQTLSIASPVFKKMLPITARPFMGQGIKKFKALVNNDN